MVTVDRYTGYFFVNRLKQVATKDVIDVLQTIFLDYGYPEKLRTDGGPQFRGEFEEYCKNAKIIHCLSSPYYPQSNGHAEAAVRQAKLLIEKVGYGPEFKTALLDWRNTPLSDGRPAPSETMFGRILRHRLPLFRNSVPMKKVKPTRFEPGDKVRVQDPKTRRWDRIFELVKRRKSGSWILVNENGDSTIRNEIYIRKYVPPISKNLSKCEQDDSKVKNDRVLRNQKRVNYKV